jgi:hypothetical protein
MLAGCMSHAAYVAAACENAASPTAAFAAAAMASLLHMHRWHADLSTAHALHHYASFCHYY